MLFRLDDLKKKEVIDISTGERMGFIDDAEIDVSSSQVKSLVIYGRERFFGLLGREDDIIIPCSSIVVIGSDVVLVRHREKAYALNTYKKSTENSDE